MSEVVTFSHCKKLRLENPTLWEHHHGGWTYVMGLIESNLCCDEGVLFISSVEDIVADETIIQEPWVGVVHQVPKNNYKWFPDLERIVLDDNFQQSLKSCHGLFTLSSVVSDFLKKHIPEVPVARLLYPMTPTQVRFNEADFFSGSSKTILFIGEFMRNFQYFFDINLPSSFKKVLLKSHNVSFDKLGITTNSSVDVREYVDGEEYENLLSSSVVFLNLFDAAANTATIECLARNTPILVNRLPGIEEYLGKDYPLFYDSAKEAIELLSSNDALDRGVNYLENIAIKPSLTGKHFLKTMQNSAIYRSLPVPTSQRAISGRMPKYDMSVIICSYKRVYNMRRLLQAFVDQDIDRSFEVIIWNNNFDARNELQGICDGFTGKLEVKVIHSTDNYYCIIRLAVASLIRSDVMVICDDDVVPSSHFLSGYMSKYEQRGPDCVLTCRGHKFWRHKFDEEHPEICWMEYENLRFYDEKQEDTQIHFFHADTCLIPKHILLKALQYPLPWYDVILVDDYWLSYVFSHLLRVPIWKIKGDHLFHSTPCAEDPSIALFLNSRVREERVNFYVYHMRQGWPDSVVCIGEDETR